MRHDRASGARRARVVQAIFLQAGLAVILLTFLFISWGDVGSMALFGVTLLIPVGWSAVFWRAWKRDSAERKDARWSKESDRAAQKRMFMELGVVFAAWLLLAAAVVLFL